MSVLAMLERLDQMGLKRVYCVILENIRQQQDLLHVRSVRPASFRLWQDRIRMGVLATQEALDRTALEHARRVIMAPTK